MERYDAETWHCKSVEYILRKHIAYDKTNDAIVVMYPLVDKPWKKHHYSLFLESLCSPEAAARAFKRISIKPWWSERVGDAIKEAQRKVVTGNMDGLRVIEREVMRRAYHR